MAAARTALVTGPTAGIGLAFAEALAASGHDVVLVARDADRLAALATRLEAEYRVGVEVLPADLSDRAQLARVEERVADREHPIDILVNNAGFGLKRRFGRTDVDDEQRMLDVLVTAVMRLSHAAVPAMTERRTGGIVNVSSVAGWITGGTYSAAKAWVTVFSEGLATELRGTGVGVVAVCPGFVRTEFHERADMDMSQIPDWMWLDARDVAARGLRDLESGRVVSVTGTQYRLLTQALRHLPRSLVRRASAQRRR